MALVSITQAPSETRESVKHSPVQVQGAYRGVQITLNQTPNAASQLQSAAEEMSFHQAEKRSEKGLDKRSFSLKQPAHTQIVSTQVQEADFREEASFFAGERKQKTKTETEKELSTARKTRDGQQEALGFRQLLQKLPDLKTQDLARLWNRLEDSAPQSLEDLEKMLKEQFSDVSHRYAGLVFLKEKLSAQIKILSQIANPDVIQELEQSNHKLMLINMLLLDMENIQGPLIRAGLNITQTALAFAQTCQLDSVEGLRGFYRETVIGYDRKLIKIYQNIITKYGFLDFLSAVDFLRKSVSSDMHSEGPSIDKNKLKELIDDTVILKAMEMVHMQGKKLIKRAKFKKMKNKKTLFSFRSQNNDEDLTEQEMKELNRNLKDLMTCTMDLIEQGFFQKTKNAQVMDLIDRKLGLSQNALAKKITFSTGYRELVALIPVRLFADMNKRLDLLAALQATMDAYIEVEI